MERTTAMEKNLNAGGNQGAMARPKQMRMVPALIDEVIGRAKGSGLGADPVLRGCLPIFYGDPPAVPPGCRFGCGT
jgi:hypothetical protein